MNNYNWAPIFIRVAGVGASIATSIVIAEQLSLAEIGYYFLFATLAYFGSAGLYVGCGVAIQKRFALLASSDEIDKHSLIKFVVITLVFGAVAVFFFSASYLILKGSGRNIWATAFCCASLSAATYLSNVSKDLTALSRRLTAAASLALFEQIVRLGFVVAVLGIASHGALQVTGATAVAVFLTGVCGLAFLYKQTKTVREIETNLLHLGRLTRTIGPIGISGILNWLQLQGYRPALLYLGIQPEIIGVISLFTSLGMTGASPVLVVATQSYIPKIYVNQLGALRLCIKRLAFLSVGLAILSIPASFFFLYLSHRQGLARYVFLVPIGVMAEATNNIVGAFMHRQNVGGHGFSVFAAASCLGLIVTAAFLIIPPLAIIQPYFVGAAILVSQAAVLAFVALFRSRW